MYLDEYLEWNNRTKYTRKFNSESEKELLKQVLKLICSNKPYKISYKHILISLGIKFYCHDQFKLRTNAPSYDAAV